MNDLKSPRKISAIVMAIAFFLPLFSIAGFISMSSASLPSAIASFADIGSAFSEDAQSVSTIQYYLIYLILGFAVWNIADKKESVIAIFGAPVAVFGLIVYALVAVGSDISEVIPYLGIGFWAMLASSIATVVIFFKDKAAK